MTVSRVRVKRRSVGRRLTARRAVGVLVACSVMVAAFVASGQAASGKNTAAARSGGNSNPLHLITPGVLRVATIGGAKPYAYQTPTGKWIGFEADLLKNVTSQIPSIKKVVFVEQDFASLFAAVAARKYDIAAACFGDTKAREQTVDFTHSYNNGYLVFFSKPGAGISSAADLSGKRVGTLTGSVEEQYLKDKVPAAQIVGFPDNNSAVQALLSGSVDAVFADTSTAKDYEKQYSLAEDFKVVSAAPCAWPISKHDKALKAALNRGLDKAICTGVVAGLTRKWLVGSPILPAYKKGQACH
jgi:polar amino acid transport system substrate-binding protein